MTHLASRLLASLQAHPGGGEVAIQRGRPPGPFEESDLLTFYSEGRDAPWVILYIEDDETVWLKTKSGWVECIVGEDVDRFVSKLVRAQGRQK